MVERVACGCGDLAVGGYFSFGDGADDASEGCVALVVFAGCLFEDSSLDVRWDGRAHVVDFIRVFALGSLGEGDVVRVVVEKQIPSICGGMTTKRAMKSKGQRYVKGNDKRRFPSGMTNKKGMTNKE
jgi:hypothetical protein